MCIQFLWRAIRPVAAHLPLLRDVVRTSGSAAHVTVGNLLVQRVLGFNRDAYWPMHPTSRVTNARKVRTGIGTAPGLSRGCYIQAYNGIEIGDYTVIGPNVGLISSNHDPYDISSPVAGDPIRIGRYCWIGMNAVVLPGVTLGDHTVVGAGAVVTHSFPEGYCTLGGVPATVIKTLDRDRVAEHRYEIEYVGYHFLGGRTKEELFEQLGLLPLNVSAAGGEPA